MENINDTEIWRDVKGFEGLYKVNRKGEIYSVLKNIIRPPKDNGYGYDNITLNKNGKKITKYIHRIVAEAFISNPNNYPMVNHKDENKKNNNVENLEWCTASYNVNYGTGKTRAIIKYKETWKNMNEEKRKEISEKHRKISIKYMNSISKEEKIKKYCSKTTFMNLMYINYLNYLFNKNDYDKFIFLDKLENYKQIHDNDLNETFILNENSFIYLCNKDGKNTFSFTK
jgi:hypothetical protein